MNKFWYMNAFFGRGNQGGGGVGSLQFICISDPHSGRNGVLGGTDEVMADAYTALPADIKENAHLILLGGDYFNAAVADTEHGEGVADEVAVMGVTRTFPIEGNHDWYNDLFHNYLDPLGENTETSGRNPANFVATPVGDRRAYYLRSSKQGNGKGNLLFIMLGDNQNSTSPQGESSEDFGSKSWNAAGGISNTAWRWLIKTVLANLDCNIIIHTHQPLKDTRISSGFNDGNLTGVAWLDPTVNGNMDFEQFRSSYLAFIENVPAEQKFHDFCNSVFGFPVAWLSGHNHLGVDEVINGLTWIETAYGFAHVNVCSAADKLFHPSFRSFITPQSKVMTVQNSTLNIKTHVHIETDGRAVGYQDDIEQNVSLRFPYNEEYESTDPTAPAAPTISSIDVSEKGCATVHISKGSADGVLVVRKMGEHATFTPTENSEYFRGDTAGDGVVVYMGTVTNFLDYGLFGGDQYYTVYSFNGRNDKIKYSATAAQANATVVTADTTKILAAMSEGDGSPVVYLDARLGVTVDESGNVSSWADQSGNGLDAAQASSGNRPAYDAVNKRISFVASSSEYLSIPYNALHHFGYAPEPTWLHDVPCAFFAKVKMTDASGFRILGKISGSDFEFQITTQASDDLLNLSLYAGVLGDRIEKRSSAALTSLEGDDIFIFVNYYGGKRFEWGGAMLYVYNSSFELVVSSTISANAATGTYTRMTDHELPLEIGRINTGTPDYADGEINGIVIKRGDVFHQHEMNYLMDNFTW